MSWIEGVGDEVTITFSILLGLFVLLLAWFSTGIREIPFISVIIVQLTRRRVRAQNVDRSQPQTETAETSPDGNQREATEADQDTAQSPDSNVELPPSVSSEDTSNVDNKTVVDNISSASNSNEETESRHIEEVQVAKNKVTTNTEDGNSSTTENTETLTENENIQPSEDTGVTALPEQELRQKRLEFFIKGSPATAEELGVSQCENASNSESSNQTPSSSGTDQPTSPTKNSPPSSTSDTNADASSATVENDGRTQSVPDSEGADEIRVRIKFFNDEQRSVTCSPTDTIGNFRRRHFSTELSESKLVRFIFNGQDLRNDASTLQSYNIMDNSVLHCLITQPQPTAQPGSEDDEGMDMGIFMFPLFGLLLAIVWYMRFMYRQFFNVTSTLTLGGITFLYLAAFLSTMRGRRHEHLD